MEVATARDLTNELRQVVEAGKIHPENTVVSHICNQIAAARNEAKNALPPNERRKYLVEYPKFDHSDLPLSEGNVFAIRMLINVLKK